VECRSLAQKKRPAETGRLGSNIPAETGMLYVVGIKHLVADSVPHQWNI